MKSRFIALGLGVLTVVVVFAIAFFASGDLRFIYASGAVLLLCFAIWLGAAGNADWLAAILLSVPLFAGFSFFLLSRVPALWPNLALWAVGVAIGLLFSRALHARRGGAVAVALAVLIFGSLWYCISYLPGLLARELNHFNESAAPAFALQPVDDGPVPLAAKSGKVLVIDFFATWCIPCNAELPELEAVQSELKKDTDIEFVLVDSNAGGDNPERFRSFARKRNITLPLAFDPDGKARASFGMTGFPSIVVIDGSGRIRLTREGYNPAEANFRRNFVQFLKRL